MRMLGRMLVAWWWMARIRILAQMAYPLMFAGWLVTIPFQYLIGVWVLVAMVDRFQGLAGWSSDQMLFLYGLSVLGHGVQVTMGVSTWWMDRHLNEGAFDRWLVRPLPVSFQFIFGFINMVGLIDCIPAAIILAAGWSRCGIELSLWNLAMAAAVVAGAAMIRTAIYIVAGAPAFWMGRAGSLTWSVHELSERLSHYPIDIFPRAVQWLLTLALPFAFCATIPAAALLGRDGRIAAEALYTPVVGIAALLAAIAVFHRGLSRYESTGS